MKRTNGPDNRRSRFGEIVGFQRRLENALAKGTRAASFARVNERGLPLCTLLDSNESRVM